MKKNKIVSLTKDGNLKLPPEILEQLSPNTSFEVSLTAEEIIFRKIVNTNDNLSKNNLHFLSESVLAKDWLKSEEDEAWQDL